MPSLTQNKIDAANKTDLAAFLVLRGIHLRKQSDQFIWDEQNVWIHGPEWYSHYDQSGGRAILFAMKYLRLSFTEAVNELTGGGQIQSNQSTNNGYRILLPQSSKNAYRVFMYLRNSRCISPEVIDYFIRRGLIYEDAEYHCCIFVGRDINDCPRHAHKRSTQSMFKQTIEGSKAEYSFHYIGYSNTIFAFESPIDMLAYISMHPDGWRRHSYVALCSVSDKALVHQLEMNQRLKKIVLCLDHDEAGLTAAIRIKELLQQKGYSDVQIEIPINKDWDEDLQVLRGVKKGIMQKEG